MDIALDPVNHVLYYMTRDRAPSDPLLIGSLRAVHVRTFRTVSLMGNSLHDPRSLALDTENG